MTAPRPARPPPLARQETTTTPTSRKQDIMTNDPMKPPAEAPAGKTTAQVYADRILPGYAADEKLREQVRQQEMEARGIIAAQAEEPDEDAVEEPEPEPAPEVKPARTADVYARRTLAVQSAEAASALVAQHGVARHVPWSAA